MDKIIRVSGGLVEGYGGFVEGVLVVRCGLVGGY